MKKNIVKTAIIMSLLTLGSQFFGFIRELVMANYFGTTYIVDAFAMSNTILNLLFGGLIVAITAAYMPLYSKVVEQKGELEGNTLTVQVVNILLLITIFISFIGILFSDQIIYLCAKGFTGETARLASYYTKIIFSYIIFSSISGILESYLQYKGIFIPQIISGYFISICGAIAIVIGAHTSYYYIAYGILTGNILRSICMIFVAKKNGYKYKLSIPCKGQISGVLSLALPVFLGSSIDAINKFIDRTLASYLKEGSIAALNYSNLIDNMIITITITVIATIIYPKLTQAYSNNNENDFNKLVSSGVSLVLIIAIPCSLGAMIYSSQIITIVYERGAFGSVATGMTAGAFFYYSMGLVFLAMSQFISKVYYSMHNMKTPMIFGILSVGVNIILDFLLVGNMQHMGLALATSIASCLNVILLLIGIKYKYPNIRLISSKVKVIVIFGSAIVALVLSYIIYRIISVVITVEMIRLGIVVVVASLVYVILLKIFKVEEVELIKAII